LRRFLFLDSNNYAFIADKKVLWMVNGLTTSDMYPYGFRERLGDKADERAVHAFEERTINYAEDSVKITMDAYSGEITLYQMNDDPIISSWARVYPDLFKPASAMPAPFARSSPTRCSGYTSSSTTFTSAITRRTPRSSTTSRTSGTMPTRSWDRSGGAEGIWQHRSVDFSYEGHPMLIDPADLPAA
jgi:hypothetical protein